MISKKTKKNKVFAEIQRLFLAVIRNLSFFSAKNRRSPKKKRKTVFAEIERPFLAKITNLSFFFRPKTGDLKKKRSSPTMSELQNQKTPLFCSKWRHVLHNLGSQIPLGGLFSILEQKSAPKALETCDFAYFSGQLGGSSPPLPSSPPGYATDGV